MKKEIVTILSNAEIGTLYEILEQMKELAKCSQEDMKKIKCITCSQTAILLKITNIEKILEGTSYLND